MRLFTNENSSCSVGGCRGRTFVPPYPRFARIRSASACKDLSVARGHIVLIGQATVALVQSFALAQTMSISPPSAILSAPPTAVTASRKFGYLTPRRSSKTTGPIGESKYTARSGELPRILSTHSGGLYISPRSQHACAHVRARVMDQV